MTCIVNLPSTVDIPVTVDVVWNEPNEATLNYTIPVMMENLTEYISIAVFVSDVQSDTINFQCTAGVSSNSYFISASKSRAVNENVFVVGSPSQPIGMNASVGSTVVNITWSKRSNDIVHQYELQYSYRIRECLNNSGTSNITELSNSSRSHTLENQEEDSDFTISLFAINPAGKSEAATVMATTLPSGASNTAVKNSILTLF